jgi:para-nitrobenzyl esterase
MVRGKNNGRMVAMVGAAALVLAVSSSRADEARPIVSVDTGMLRGTNSGIIEGFKGIPYAAPPVGALRWQPPQPAPAWTGVRDASDFETICPQPSIPEHTLAAVMGADQKQSEDCLFLNVWTFNGARKAPVMVWIHGGAFRFGSGSAFLYNGTDFAKDGVVLVTINYRLGALGFFAHPELTKAAAPDAPLGNYGIMDQIAALRWVKRNIAVFGGDPDNVTVFGESAGGVSVLTLLTTPAAKGLFAKAIVESGGGWEAPRTLADEEESGLTLAVKAGLGADATLEQLRALPAEKLLDSPWRFGGIRPFKDGRLIKENLTQAFAEGHEIGVPLIIGSNSDEASLMRLFDIPAASIAALVPANLKSLYSGTEQEMANAAFTDGLFGAPARWIAGRVSERAPAFLYHFSFVPPALRGASAGAAHGGEVPFVFGSWLAPFDRMAAPETHAMEALVHGCWVAFAKTGNPTDGKTWPTYSLAADELMEFGETSGLVAHFHKPQYDGLESAMLPQLIGK